MIPIRPIMILIPDRLEAPKASSPFLRKKDQKTFASSGARGGKTRHIDRCERAKSFLLLFLEKEGLVLLRHVSAFEPVDITPEPKSRTTRGLALACFAASVIGATPAAAHAFLESASPRVGSNIPAAPPEVILTYTQGIEPDFSRIEVQDGSGAAMASGPAHTEPGDPAKFAVPLKRLPAGTYVVIWHVTSVDTHKTQGRFHFTVGP